MRIRYVYVLLFSSLAFRFPIMKFVKEIFVYYDLAPAQLMPDAWRILLKMEVLTEKFRIKFLVTKFINYYSLVENSDNLGRYFFRLRHKYSSIIDSPTSNKLWKSKFIFVRGSLRLVGVLLVIFFLL